MYVTALPNVVDGALTVPFVGALAGQVTGAHVGALPLNVVSTWQVRVAEPPLPVKLYPLTQLYVMAAG